MKKDAKDPKDVTSTEEKAGAVATPMTAPKPEVPKIPPMTVSVLVTCATEQANLLFTKGDKDLMSKIKLAALGKSLEGHDDDEPVLDLVVTITDAQAIGRLLTRSVVAFSRIGVMITTDAKMEATSATFSVEAGPHNPLCVGDLPLLINTLVRVALRASTSMSWTHHPLTLFDLKQSTGIVNGVTNKVHDDAEIDTWMAQRELALLNVAKAAAESEKKEKAAKEAAKAAKDPKAPATPKGDKSATPATPKGTEKNGPKATGKATTSTPKATGKAAQTKKASLGSLE